MARTASLHRALGEAVGELEENPMDLRATVTMEALLVAEQHGRALRELLSLDLQVSAMGMMRLQYEAVLRAIWLLFAASDDEVRALAAPLTPRTLKSANSLGMAGELLGDIEKSQAPADLKRSMREFRTSLWDVMNSYVHAGLFALRRHDAHLEHELATMLRMSNGLANVTCGLLTIVGHRPERQANINVVCLTFPECMPPRHTDSSH